MKAIESLIQMNFGGTSSSEGGMGSGSKSSVENGAVNTKDQKVNTKGNSKSDSSDTFDPIKKEVKKAEKTRNK